MIDVEERLRDALRIAGDAKQREIDGAPRAVALSPQDPQIQRQWSRRVLVAAIVMLLVAAGVAVRANLRDEREGLSARTPAWFLPTYLPDGYELNAASISESANKAQDAHITIRIYGRVDTAGNVVEGIGVGTYWNGGPSSFWSSGARDAESVAVEGCGGVTIRGVGLSTLAMDEIKATLWCNSIDGIPFGDIQPPVSYQLLAADDLAQAVSYASLHYGGLLVMFQSRWPDALAEDWFSGFTRTSEPSPKRMLTVRESSLEVGPSAFTVSFIEHDVRVSVSALPEVDKQTLMRIVEGMKAVSEREWRAATAEPNPLSPSPTERFLVPATVPNGYGLKYYGPNHVGLITADKQSSVTLQSYGGFRIGLTDGRTMTVNGRKVVLYTYRLENPPAGFNAQPATIAQSYFDGVYIEAVGNNVSDEFIARIVAEAVPVDEAGFHEFLRRNGLEN